MEVDRDESGGARLFPGEITIDGLAEATRALSSRNHRLIQGAIDEVLQIGLAPAYVHYLAAKIKPLVAEKAALLRPRLDDPSDSRAS